MQTAINRPRMTAQMKITKPDGTATIHEVEMTDEEQEKFLNHIEEENNG